MSSSVQLLAVDSSICLYLGLSQLHDGADHWCGWKIMPPKQKETKFLVGLSLSKEMCSDMAKSPCDIIVLRHSGLHPLACTYLGCEAPFWHQWYLWVLTVVGDQNWGFQVKHTEELSKELGTAWEKSGLDVCTGFTPRYCLGSQQSIKWHYLQIIPPFSFFSRVFFLLMVIYLAF